MKLYKILDIQEADYGCEECPKDDPHALLNIDDGKSIEVSEKWIADNGIKEGKLIHIKEDGSVMKAIRVVAAVITAEFDSLDTEHVKIIESMEDIAGISEMKDHKHKVTKVFATQRGYGELEGGWEFPGGKIEEGETPQQALKREIMEELDTEIEVGEMLDVIEYDYPTFHLSMDCFWCKVVSGDLVLKEHEAAKWLSKEELDSVDWLPADVTLIEKIRDAM